MVESSSWSNKLPGAAGSAVKLLACVLRGLGASELACGLRLRRSKTSEIRKICRAIRDAAFANVNSKQAQRNAEYKAKKVCAVHEDCID